MSRVLVIDDSVPWELLWAAILGPANAFDFELYSVAKDWTQSTDLAASEPDFRLSGEALHWSGRLFISPACRHRRAKCTQSL
jgi:hypothetical protein